MTTTCASACCGPSSPAYSRSFGFAYPGDVLRRLRLVDRLDAVDDLAEIAPRDLNVIVVLQVEPKLRRRAERLGKPKRGVGGDAGLFAGDPLDPRARQAASLGEGACRYLQR